MAIKKVVKRILCKKVPIVNDEGYVFVVPVAPDSPLDKKEAGCVECGEPLAEGQTYVCKGHIRRG